MMTAKGVVVMARQGCVVNQDSLSQVNSVLIQRKITMTKKEIFVESPLKLALFAMLILSPVMAIVTGIMYPSIPIIVRIGIGFGIFAIGLLVLSFAEKKTITFDSVGCQVRAKHYWKSFEETYDFKWSEVTAARVIFYEADGGDGGTSTRTHFEVVVNGQARELKQWDRFSAKSFDRVIELVNEATPHLPYVWVKGTTNVEGMEKAAGFSKVSRS